MKIHFREIIKTKIKRITFTIIEILHIYYYGRDYKCKKTVSKSDAIFLRERVGALVFPEIQNTPIFSIRILYIFTRMFSCAFHGQRTHYYQPPTEIERRPEKRTATAAPLAATFRKLRGFSGFVIRFSVSRLILHVTAPRGPVRAHVVSRRPLTLGVDGLLTARAANRLYFGENSIVLIVLIFFFE